MKVLLYEDNAGHLFLVHAGNVWMGLEQTGSTFRVDSECILRCETDDWTVSMFNVDRTNIEEACQLVASFENGNISIHHLPGAAASLYILGEKWSRYGAEWVYSGNSAVVFYHIKESMSFPLVEVA